MSILDDKIEKAKTITVLGHMNADGDCTGSQLGVYNYILNKYNDKKVKVYILNPSHRFKYLSGYDKISEATNDAEAYDLAIVVDVPTMGRIEKVFHNYLLTAKDVIVIDHHETNDLTYKDNIAEKDAAATCEILYKLMDKNYIDKKVAECLYTGIATDTGVFRYSCTTPETMVIVSELMKKGIDFTNILDEAIFLNNMNQRKAQAIAYENAKFLCKGKVLFSYIAKDDLDELGLNKNDVDNIVVYLRETYNIKVAVFGYSIGYDIHKLSLRSNGDEYNVAKFAQRHDGGGHIRAAGCTIKGKITEVMKIINDDMNEFFHFDKE